MSLIKIFYYGLIFYLIYLVVRFFFSLSKKKPPSKTIPSRSGVMVKDEYCNTYIPREEAIREIIDGKEYFFCSRECRNKFLEKKKTG
ncbi:MAG: hypothetical protein JXB26_04750 [Candidatus Aminicenantes bacterium]|nr:hypothetical protein [Candidatus Aminicenantes bacterium]